MKGSAMRKYIPLCHTCQQLAEAAGMTMWPESPMMSGQCGRCGKKTVITAGVRVAEPSQTKADAVEHLEAAGYEVVFHVHDKVVIDCHPDRADLDRVAAIMSQPMPWAPDLPLGADGWIGDFYKKD